MSNRTGIFDSEDTLIYPRESWYVLFLGRTMINQSKYFMTASNFIWSRHCCAHAYWSTVGAFLFYFFSSILMNYREGYLRKIIRTQIKQPTLKKQFFPYQDIYQQPHRRKRFVWINYSQSRTMTAIQNGIAGLIETLFLLRQSSNFILT